MQCEIECNKYTCRGKTVFIPSFLVNIYEQTTKHTLTQDRVEGLLMCCAKRVDFENTELSDNDLNCELIFILTKELDDIREG